MPVPLLGHLFVRIVGTDVFVRVAGYSWKSSQYGLAVDSVTEFQLVLPNGTEVVVTEAEKDLWFSLKVCLGQRDSEEQ